MKRTKSETLPKQTNKKGRRKKKRRTHVSGPYGPPFVNWEYFMSLITLHCMHTLGSFYLLPCGCQSALANQLHFSFSTAYHGVRQLSLAFHRIATRIDTAQVRNELTGYEIALLPSLQYKTSLPNPRSTCGTTHQACSLRLFAHDEPTLLIHHYFVVNRREILHRLVIKISVTSLPLALQYKIP